MMESVSQSQIVGMTESSGQVMSYQVHACMLCREGSLHLVYSDHTSCFTCPRVIVDTPQLQIVTFDTLTYTFTGRHYKKLCMPTLSNCQWTSKFPYCIHCTTKPVQISHKHQHTIALARPVTCTNAHQSSFFPHFICNSASWTLPAESGTVTMHRPSQHYWIAMQSAVINFHLLSHVGANIPNQGDYSHTIVFPQLFMYYVLELKYSIHIAAIA